MSFPTYISSETKVKRKRKAARACSGFVLGFVLRQRQGTLCPSSAVAEPAQLPRRCIGASISFCWESGSCLARKQGSGSLPSLWLPAIWKCSGFRVSLLALCILLQQLASDLGILPESGYAGCSCKYMTASAASTGGGENWKVKSHGLR